MSKERIISAVRESLANISHPRFFQTERGYQGELLAELRERLPGLNIAEGRAIVEQEYQKTLPLHGVKRRPDLLIHEPFDPDHRRSRSQGNHAVFELKRRATPKGVAKDFESLNQLVSALQYPLAIFVNIDSHSTQANHAPRNLSGILVAFAVKLKNGKVVLNEAHP